MSTGLRPVTVEVLMSLSVLMTPARARDGSGPEPLAELTEARERVLGLLPAVPTLVILTTGSEPLAEEVSALDLGDQRIPVASAPELVTAVVERGQVPRVQAAALGGRAAALAVTVHAARPDARFVGVTIPGLADLAAIEGAIAALRGAVAASDDVVLVVPGDLGPDRAAAPGATDGPDASRVAEEVLNRVRAALAAHDTAALAVLAADHEELAGALAPVRLALGIAGSHGQRFTVHAWRVVDGVLQVIGATA